jgi:hypothetical protein
MQEPLPEANGPLLADPVTAIPRIAETLFACPPAERCALVQRAFAPDADYTNSFVGSR